MQIHDLNQFVGALNSGAFIPVDNGTDTGKLSFTDILGANSVKSLMPVNVTKISEVNDEVTLTAPVTDFDYIEIFYAIKHPITDGYNREYKTAKIPKSKLPGKAIISGQICGAHSADYLEVYEDTLDIQTNKIVIESAKEWHWNGVSSSAAAYGDASTTYIEIYRVDGITTPANSKGVIALKTVTLPKTGWSSLTQTVAVDDVTANNSVLVCAAPSSQTAFMGSGVYCSAQGANSLTFTCGTTPTIDLTVNVIIVG